MPSPVGHALGGAIVGELSAARSTHAVRRLTITCAIVACLPDLDFLWGRHNMETHSLGAAMLAGLATLALTRGRNLRLALAVVLAWTSHVVFDWLGSDTTPPLGVMTLWPLSNDYYFSNAFVFEAISRRYWLDNFWRHNIMAVVSEVVMLAPILLLARRSRRRSAGSTGSTGSADVLPN